MELESLIISQETDKMQKNVISIYKSTDFNYNKFKGSYFLVCNF